MREGPSATWADRAVDLALRGLIAGAMRLPYERRVPFMGALARRGVGPLAGYRARALRNLLDTFPGWSAQARAAVADEALDTFGRTIIENYSHREFGARFEGSQPTGAGLPHLAEAVASGRGVLIVTGHFGNHEGVRHGLRAAGHEVGAIYRPMHNALVDRHYAPTLAAVGPAFPKGRRGTLAFVRHLRGGGLAGLLYDLHESGGPFIPFLGRPARTALTAAELALRYDALVLPCFAVRRANGLDLDLHVEEPVAHGDPVAMMRALNERLEARVLAHPGQWFWVHRRWKG